VSTQSSSGVDAWMIPELGPSLGHLCDPPDLNPSRGVLDIGFEDIRLELVTGLFDVAGAARSFATAGDRQGAIASLARVVWISVWERAVAAAAARVAEVVNARLRNAARESRLPVRALEKFLLKDQDVRAIASRLGSGGAGFVAALDVLEQTVPAAASAGARGRLGLEEWQVALTAVARRLESAWLALTDAASSEQERWRSEIERVRLWQRPRSALWLISALVLGVLTYVGLVLGGYLPVPDMLSGVAEFWWNRL
jgi:hypothetical protein